MVKFRRSPVNILHIGVILILLSSSLVFGISYSSVGSTASESQRASPFSQVAGSDIDPDSVLMAVSIRRDGSAQWRVAYRIRLDNHNVTKAFESLKADVEDNPDPYRNSFRERMKTTVSTAENATGREMDVSNVSVAAERRQLPQKFGIIAYEFDWAGFAAVDQNRIRAGDAIASLFLDSETTFLISWPEKYRLLEIDPEPDNRREGVVSWHGRLDFALDEPLVVLSSSPRTNTMESETNVGSSSIQTTHPPPGNNGQASDGSSSANSDSFGPSLITLMVIGLLGLGGVAWWVRGMFYRDTSSKTDSIDPTGVEGNELPEELLSNEERVLSLLKKRGGRIKQKEVTETLDWTDAKTSSVVSELREAGRIESFRLGRENVLSLYSDNHRDDLDNNSNN